MLLISQALSGILPPKINTWHRNARWHYPAAKHVVNNLRPTFEPLPFEVFSSELIPRQTLALQWQRAPSLARTNPPWGFNCQTNVFLSPSQTKLTVTAIEGACLGSVPPLLCRRFGLLPLSEAGVSGATSPGLVQWLYKICDTSAHRFARARAMKARSPRRMSRRAPLAASSSSLFTGYQTAVVLWSFGSLKAAEHQYANICQWEYSHL